MSNDTKRFGVSLSRKTLDKFDKKIEKEGYNNRSEAIRDLIRDSFLEEKIADDEKVAGTLTFILDHNYGDLDNKLAEIQHKYYEKIISKMRVPLDEEKCLQIIVLIGKSGFIKKIAREIKGLRGVKHGKLTFSFSGKK